MNEEAQVLLLGLSGAGCCLVSVAGFVATLTWFFRRKPDAPITAAPPPAAAPSAGFHLSVLALALDAASRPALEAAQRDELPTGHPITARLALIQRLAHALLEVDGAWRLFGYGEKDLATLAEAQQSYGLALQDFRARALRADEGGPWSVLTLILCTRGRRLGVDRLDTRQQIRDLLGDRLTLDATTLLAAEVVWAPAAGTLSELTVRERYPEMHAIGL